MPVQPGFVPSRGPLLPFEGVEPILAEGVLILPGAFVIGDVQIGTGSSVWFNAVVRGDEAPVVIGEGTNIQDHVMVHSTRGVSQCRIGDHVTVGHRAILHGCEVGDYALVGMGAIVLDNARIGQWCLVGAGSVVLAGVTLPPRTVCVGNPCAPKRDLRPEELDFLRATAELYHRKALAYAPFAAR